MDLVLRENSTLNASALRNKVANGPISAVGAVAEGQATPNSMPFPEYISFVLDNSAGTAGKNYILFDAIGAVANYLGVSYSAPDSGSTGHAIVKASINSQPIIFKGYQYRVTTGTAAQFSARMEISKASIGGAYVSQRLYPEQGIRNTAQNDKVLTVNQEFTVDQLTALIINVQAGTAVSIGFWVGAQFNAF